MRFIAYKTGADRRAMKAGREVVGDVISLAPPSGHWVYVAEERRCYRVFGSAVHGQGRYMKSAIETECR